MLSTRNAIVLTASVPLFGGLLAAGFLLSAPMQADSDDSSAQPTIALTDVVDALPVCVEEDCSDQPGQVGVWQDGDRGDWYLELGESTTYRIIDDTVR